MPRHIEPELHRHRGTFQTPHTIPKSDRVLGVMRFRLGDCLLFVAPTDGPDYFTPAHAGEFCVVDVVTKEKAWFEMPIGASPEMITGMIESHFDSSAFRVGNKMWFV